MAFIYKKRYTVGRAKVLATFLHNRHFFQHLAHPHDELVYAGRIPLSVRLAHHRHPMLWDHGVK